MSQHIRILPENLTNKIAAGEVVERPASVVKELVENALDAGCSEVILEIESGGKRLIKVVDDGCGMSREDALLALERHATSKIASDADLFRLSTLGFRGEALPSIASVSRFTLASRERGKIEGTEIYAEGGTIKEVKACGMAEGTVISVRNLFFNTPARLKFMKSSETEAGHIGDIITKLAISRPEVRFTFVNDGKTVFRAANATSHDRIADLLGIALADGLYPVQFDDEYAGVTGLVAKPDWSRSTGSYTYTYINGRFIRDRVVQHAILQAYRSFLERGRYPVAVLFIAVPAEEVDVNVHPTKHEVRFRQQGRVHDAIVTAVEMVLREAPWIKRSVFHSPFESPEQPSSVSSRKVGEVKEVLERYRPGSLPRRVFTQTERPKELSFVPGIREKGEADAGQTGYFSSLSVIGQYLAAYILCQDQEDLVIIDQHAAHERVAFERLKVEFAAGAVESQTLLFPETLDISYKEAAALKKNLHGLSRIGFAVEEFGGNTWVLHAVPRLLNGRDYIRILRDVMEELQNIGKSTPFDDVIEAILARIACHSVVRGRQLLDCREISALFAQMDAADFVAHCPHGRPVIRKITFAEIEKMFRRG
jgi:DNA mismatch repair protein MutL